MKFYLTLILAIVSSAIFGQAAPAADADPLKILEWRNIGPFRGGRSCAVTGVPGKPNLFYFGATGGGVWKTMDGGRTWSNISDGFFGGSIGSISVAASDHNVIYVGGGEKTVRGNVSFGYGVWKSEDAGKTWKKSGLETSRHVGRIRIHPTNPDIVYAAVMGDLFKPTQDRGVYKSIDGGKTWKKTLFANENAGAVDLVIDPTNHRIMYASTWNVRRTPYSLSSGGEGSTLWKSSDSGETWTNLNTMKGFPSGTCGIIGVTVSPLNGEKVYALIENENGGIFVSNDGGKTWTAQSKDRSLRQRAWYYTRIYADTKDENTLYVLNVDYHKSTDGGKTFTSSEAPHGDHHDLWIAPEDPTRMIIGDDGGAQVTYDGGETWSTYHNQPTSQFYRITTDNHFPYRIYAAQQDNSTIRIQHRSFGADITEDDWEETAGGESAHIAVDPKNNDIIYGGSYGGYLTRFNHTTKSERAINVYPDDPMGAGAEAMKYRFQWNFPIFFSKHNPKKFYACSQHLHLTEDEGQTFKIISPDLTRNEAEKLGSSGGPITKDNTCVEYYATIFAAGESPLKEGLIWAGTDDGRLHVTRDAGTTWTEVTDSKIMPKYLMFNSVEPSRFAEGTCYVAGTAYKSGDYKPYLFMTTDYGKTWKQITNGIASEHFTRVVREDEVNKNILYAGTETGMYYSTDQGSNWKSLQLNLPIVPITDIHIKQNSLIAGTQGRSIWLLDDLTLLHKQEEAKIQKMYLYPPKDDYRMSGFARKGSKTTGTNKAAGIDVAYHLADFDEKKDSVQLVFFEADGDTIITYSNKDKENKLEPQKGANHFLWNMNYKGARKFDGMILWWASLQGAKAIPGSYYVELHKNGQKQKQSFNILQNPLSESKPADIKEQFDFIKSINDKVDESHKAVIDIRVLRSQFEDFKKRTDNKEVLKSIAEIDSVMTDVEKMMYQTKNKSGQDPLNYPIKLTNKLAHINALATINTGDYKPTASMYEVRDVLLKELEVQLKRWAEIKTGSLPKLNTAIKSLATDTFLLDKK
jgi:photosystem II stability/assembly factor-like uncharacterized protein